MAKPRVQIPEPDLETFGLFVAAMNDAYPSKMRYPWTRAKERSSQWLIERVRPGSTGVDVGGTEYLCERLAEKGCDVTFYDITAPKQFEKYIQDDMLNVARHFDERSLDFIVTRHTLEHSYVPMYQLWMYNQLLADDGELLVTVPCYHDRWVWLPSHHHAVPPDSWHMLFHRTGFRVLEFQIGRWRPKGPQFVEHRFRLGVESRELRLSGRPAHVLRSEEQSLPMGWALRLPPDDQPPRLRAKAGRAAMVRTRRWPSPRL